MNKPANSFFKNYSGIILLLVGIALGAMVGLLFPDSVQWLKPLGDIFLNLIFVAVIPLIFFAITSSVANISASQRLGRTLLFMSVVFLTFIVVTAITTIFTIWLFPVQQEFVDNELTNQEVLHEEGTEVWTNRAAEFVTVDDFYAP